MQCFDVQGVCVGSDLPLPGLSPLQAGLGLPSVTIEEGQLPAELRDPEISRPYYASASGEVLLRARGAGRLWIRNGTTIAYERAPGGTDANLGAHILGSGLAAIHHQRGNVVLHAASISLGANAFLVCGQSGAGKSTTTAHLLGDGAALLGDDVAAIGEAPDFMVHRGPALSKLTDEALEGLPHMRDERSNGRCTSGKSLVATHDYMANGPAPLKGIVVLEVADVDAVEKRQLLGTDAIAALRHHTFRKRFITSDNLPILFAKWGTLAQSVPIWQITRPLGLETRDEVVEQARNTIAFMQEEGSRNRA